MNNGLPPIAPFRQIGNKKRDKIHKDYKYKRYKKNVLLNLIIL